MTEHISCDCKSKFNSTICNANQKWDKTICQYECKHYHTCKKNYSWNPSTCVCENSKYLKVITDTSVAECDEIIIVMNIVSTKKTIATNVMSTASINCHSIKVRDCYILHTALLAVMLLLIITICYHYAKRKGIIYNGKC